MTKPLNSLAQQWWRQHSPWRLIVIVSAIALFFTLRNCLPVDLTEAKGDLASADPVFIRTGIAILVLAALLWLTEALPLALTALLIPVVASLTGVVTVKESFAGFSHPFIFLFLGGFGIAAGLSRQGVDAWLADRVLALGGGRFLRTSLIMFCLAAGLSMWISNTATIALLLPVSLGVLTQLSAKAAPEQQNRIALYLLLGLAYSASVGGMGTLIGSPPNGFAAENLGVGFFGWLKIGLPLVIFLLPVLFLVLFLLLRPPSKSRIIVQAKEFTFTLERALTLGIFGLTIAAWLSSKWLSELLGGIKYLDSIIALSGVLLMATFKLVRWADIDRTTDWRVLLLFGGGISLSSILGKTNASLFLASQIEALTSGWPLFLLLLAVVLFMIFLTELSSNTASAAIMVPIFMGVAVTLNLPPTTLVLPLTFAASCAFMLPIATPPNAIVFGTGKIAQRDMMRLGLVLNILFAVLLTTVAYFFY